MEFFGRDPPGPSNREGVCFFSWGNVKKLLCKEISFANPSFLVFMSHTIHVLYGAFTHIWLMFMVNVGVNILTSHGC